MVFLFLELGDFELGENATFSDNATVGGPHELGSWAVIVVVRVLNYVILTVHFVRIIVSKLPQVESSVFFQASLWGTITPRIGASDVSESESIGWVTREAALAMSGLNILDETTMDTFLGSFEHDTDTSLSVVTVNNTVSHDGIGGSPGTDGILSPGFAHLVQAVEVLESDIVRSCDLEALTSWVWSTNVLGNNILKLGSIAQLDRNTFGTSLDTNVFNDKVVRLVSIDIVA